MQYELYIDVLFLENFMMDFLVLLTVKRMLACTATYASLLLGASAGALGICLSIILPLPVPVKLLALYIPVNICMVKIGLKIQDLRTFLKALVLVYLVSFLLGGVMNWLRQYLGGYFKIGSLFFVLTICSYFFVNKGMYFLEHFWKIRDYRCRVTLCLSGRSCEVSAMIDSGNTLYDALTGKPVHIVSRDVLERLTGFQNIQHVRYIPYTTIHAGNGVLPVITIDSMQIHRNGNDGSKKMIKSPLIGISEQHHFDDGNFEMILHPKDC